MKIAVVSNGPSSRGQKLDAFDCVIAVNKAATLYRTTWWVVSDADAFIAHAGNVRVHRGQLPQLFTRGCIRKHLTDLYSRPDMVPLFDMMPAMYQDHFPYKLIVATAAARYNTAWNQWSGLAAMGLAWLINHHAVDRCSIELFGYDLAGTDDCLGAGSPKEHHSRGLADRWPREKAMTHEWVSALMSAGAEVRYASPIG